VKQMLLESLIPASRTESDVWKY